MNPRLSAPALRSGLLALLALLAAAQFGSSTPLAENYVGRPLESSGIGSHGGLGEREPGRRA